MGLSTKMSRGRGAEGLGDEGMGGVLI